MSGRHREEGMDDGREEGQCQVRYCSTLCLVDLSQLNDAILRLPLNLAFFSSYAL